MKSKNTNKLHEKAMAKLARNRKPHLCDVRTPPFVASLEIEAQASCSLDGCTQSCPACVQKVEHVCGKRVMTEAERELVEAALRHDMIAVMDAEKKVRAERKEAAK